jgi:hypothetical protein
VTVGGDQVELVSATGSRASFRVPGLGAVGDVVVEARDPGEHVGRIGLSVRFDGRTNAIVEERRPWRLRSARGRHDRRRGNGACDPRGRCRRGDDHGDAAALTPGLALCGGAGQFFEDPNAAIERFDGRKV